MDQFDTLKMASGGLALVLEPSSTWGEFPAHVEKWKRRLGAMSLSKAVITFDECIAEVAVADGEFWITYDDFQSSIQLEPKKPRYNNIVSQLQAEGGRRLFEVLPSRIELEIVRVIDTQDATHIRYRVRR